MTILALEFSSDQRSVAVSRGGIVLGEAMERGGRNLASFKMIQKALAQAKMEREEIEAISVGLGPGSYTGIRAAIALAQGWQLGQGVKTIGVSSVEAMAAQAQVEKIFGRVNVVVNAQRQEFYIATYELTATSRTQVGALKILPLAEVQSRARAAEVLAGPEAAKFFPGGREIFPRAGAVAALAADRTDFLAGEKLEPIYLRETNFVKTRPVS